MCRRTKHIKLENLKNRSLFSTVSVIIYKGLRLSSLSYRKTVVKIFTIRNSKFRNIINFQEVISILLKMIKFRIEILKCRPVYTKPISIHRLTNPLVFGYT